MTIRWIYTTMTVLLLGLSIVACGKKPREIEPLPGSPKLPTQYPTMR